MINLFPSPFSYFFFFFFLNITSLIHFKITKGGGEVLCSFEIGEEVDSSPATAQIAPMPPRSIVLKPMMWPVRGSGYTALPVWDNLSSDDNTYAGFEIQRKWKRAVAVTAHPTAAIVSVNVSYLHGVYKANVRNPVPVGPLAYRGAKVVPVSAFYSFRFPHLDRMHPCDRAILDASAYWAYGRAFSKDDYLVLVAMHVLTKEQPDWTFQSVWWHDHPNQGPYAENRPNIPVSQAPGPWRHYLMTSTYGITQPPPNTNKWPIAYNPYIELAADHPIATSCINCHRRAAWPNFGRYSARSPLASRPSQQVAQAVTAQKNRGIRLKQKFLYLDEILFIRRAASRSHVAEHLVPPGMRHGIGFGQLARVLPLPNRRMIRGQLSDRTIPG